MLLEIRKTKPLPVFTPTKWQTVILRNYGLVDENRLASVLKTDAITISKEAKRLGLGAIRFNPKWEKLGYITIIKNNWHLLPYDQLIEILGTDEATLDFILREDDFLNVKLGLFKPYCEPVAYYPLTKSQIEETERISALISQHFIHSYATPFDFYSDFTEENSAQPNYNPDFDRIVYSYSALYGDPFIEEGEIIPEKLLRRMQEMGVNGIWMQGVLAKLSPYPFVKGVDEGYETRRKNLSAFISKCQRYGIGVYLYLNEPRGIASDCLTPETEKIKGRFYEERWSLCTTTQPVKDYLYEAVKSLVCAVPDLAGIITITMSENMTNCHSRKHNDCPHCKHLRHQDVVPEVNNIMQRAVADAGVKTRIIANLWAWTEAYDWSKQDVLEGIENMDEEIDVLSVSEMGTVLDKNGNPYRVDEYSLSKIGPCEQTKINLTHARNLGHKIMAKVQINNSWEIAVVPYVPVFELIMEHMLSLKKLGVGGLMMSWTLGGFPTVSLDLAGRIWEDGFNYDRWLSYHFGEKADLVKRASALFSDGFRLYPYDIHTLYYGNQQCGPSNLMYDAFAEYKSTMVGFPYDDVKSWFGYHDKEDYVTSLSSLLSLWQEGLALIENQSGNTAFEQMKRYAKTVFVNLKSTLVQIEFNLLKAEGDKAKLLSLIREERELTKALYELASTDCKIGYEASNHYYFTQNTFLEKIINLDYLESLYK